MKVGLLATLPLLVQSQGDTSTLLSLKTNLKGQLSLETGVGHLLDAVGTRNVTQMSSLLQNLVEDTIAEGAYDLDGDVKEALKMIKEALIGDIQGALKEAHCSDQVELHNEILCFQECENKKEDGAATCGQYCDGSAHKECRDGLLVKYQEHITECRALDAFMKDFEADCPKAEKKCCLLSHTTWNCGGLCAGAIHGMEVDGYFGTWLQEQLTKFQTTYEQWMKLHAQCTAAYHAYVEVDAKCDCMQAECETNNCRFETCHYLNCEDNYNKCWAHCEATWDNTRKTKECLEKDRKIDWSATEKIECYVDVLLAAPTKQELLDTCGTEDCINKFREIHYKYCNTICPEVDFETGSYSEHKRRDDDNHQEEADIDVTEEGENSVRTTHRAADGSDALVRCTSHLDLDFPVPPCCNPCDPRPEPPCTSTEHVVPAPAQFQGTCTCVMTSDNDIDYVYVDGVDMTRQVTPFNELGNWPANKHLTFECNEHTKMAVQASDGGSFSAGCRGGGFGMKCTSTNSASPWHGLETGPQWKAWGAQCTTYPCKYGRTGDDKNTYDPPAPANWFANDFDDSHWKQADAGNDIGTRTGAKATICSADGPGWLFRSPAFVTVAPVVPEPSKNSYMWLQYGQHGFFSEDDIADFSADICHPGEHTYSYGYNLCECIECGTMPKVDPPTCTAAKACSRPGQYDYSKHDIKVDCAATTVDFAGPSIKLSTGVMTSKPDAATFEDAVDASVTNSPYCSKELDNVDYSNGMTCGAGNRNIAYKLEVTFQVCEPGTWHFDFNVDFGWGGVVRFDGIRSPEGYHSGDHWWSHDLNRALPLDLGHHFDAGVHTMVVYGAEGCCDGRSNVRIQKPGGSFEPLSIASLACGAVDED